MHEHLRTCTHTHAYAHTITHTRHGNSCRMSTRLPLIQITPCDDHVTVLDSNHILSYFIIFRRLAIFLAKNVCLKPKTVITDTDDVHKSQRGRKENDGENIMFTPYWSPADALRLSVSHTHTHARRARLHTSVHKNF